MFKSLIVLIGIGWLLAAPVTAETEIERGEYLVRGIAGCGNCHTPIGPEGFIMQQEFAGRLVEKNEAFTAIAPNITPSSRIANWTDKQLKQAIREGLRPDGSLIGPPMPFAMYRGLSDTDVDAMIAFLRTVPAVASTLEPSEYHVTLPKSYGPPVGSIVAIPASVTVEYGEYLAGPIAHCMECHTPRGPTGPMLSTDLGRGGLRFAGPWGVSIASNITHHADGLATYSDEEIVAMIAEGRRPDGSKMLPPMPYEYLAKMSDADMKAILLYLRSLKPIPNVK